MPKPIHPATVHFPISFLLLSTALDITAHFHTSLPSTLITILPFSAPELSKIAYHLLLLGILSILPAVSTGVTQLLGMIQKQGLYEADGSTIRPKVKITLLHAAVNDIVLVTLGYVFYQRYLTTQSVVLGGAKALGGEGLYRAEGWQVAVEGGLMGLMLFGANLGGNLTYLYGVGLSAGNTSGTVKKRQ